jgi:hypothetical protein
MALNKMMIIGFFCFLIAFAGVFSASFARRPTPPDLTKATKGCENNSSDKKCLASSIMKPNENVSSKYESFTSSCLVVLTDDSQEQI